MEAFSFNNVKSFKIKLKSNICKITTKKLTNLKNHSCTFRENVKLKLHCDSIIFSSF